MKVNKFLLLLTFLSTIALASTPSQQLVSLLTNLQTMQANFTQTTTNNPQQQFSGTMALQRPGKFRWEVSYPSKQLIVVTGNNIWIYYADLKQAVKRNLDYQAANNPAMLLSGSTKLLTEQFIIKDKTSINSDDSFILQPKKKGVINTVTLYFTSGQLRKMVLVDNLEQTTTFSFQKIKVNQQISAKLFEFNPPAGTDIVTE